MRRSTASSEGARAASTQVHALVTTALPAMAQPRDERGQALATSLRDGLLTIMTPVFPDNDTLALLHNQVRPPPRFSERFSKNGVQDEDGAHCVSRRQGNG